MDLAMTIRDFFLNSLLSNRMLFILCNSSCLRFLSYWMALSFSLACSSNSSFLVLGCLNSTSWCRKLLFSLLEMPGMNYVSFLWESSYYARSTLLHLVLLHTIQRLLLSRFLRLLGVVTLLPRVYPLLRHLLIMKTKMNALSLTGLQTALEHYRLCL